MNILYGNKNPNDPRFYLTSHYWIRCSVPTWLLAAIHVVLSTVATVEIIYKRVHGHQIFTFQAYVRTFLFINLTVFLCYGMISKKSYFIKFVARVYSLVASLFVIMAGYTSAMAIFPNPFARPFLTDDDFLRVVDSRTPDFNNDLFAKYFFFAGCLGVLAFQLFTIHMIFLKYARQLVVLYEHEDAEAFAMD